jgi:hypothetical protein
VAPRLRAFAGADVTLDAPFEGLLPYAACLAIEAPPETYDWEVRESLLAWCEGTGTRRLVGLAAGERQRYRGLALVFADERIDAPVVQRATLVQGRTRGLA